MYTLNFTDKFFRKAKKLIKKNQSIKPRIDKTILLLEVDVFYPSLKSHKVNTKEGERFSSRVTDDIRMIWKFHKKRAYVIDVMDIGGHEGKDKVYK